MQCTIIESDLFHKLKEINILCNIIENDLYKFTYDKLLKDRLIKVRELIYIYECDNYSSLNNGYCQVAFSVNKINNIVGIGKKISDKLNRLIIDSVNKKIFHARLNRYTNTSEVYDIENGLSGTLVYLLSMESDENLDVLLCITKYLIELSKPIEVYGFIVPGWLSYDNKESVGDLKIGLYNGISGLLLALVLAYKKGIREHNHIEAMERIANFLINIISNNKLNSCPISISFEEYILGIRPKYVNNISIRNGLLGIIISLFIWSQIMKREDINLMCVDIFNNISKKKPEFNTKKTEYNNMDFEIQLIERIVNLYSNNIKVIPTCNPYNDYLKKLFKYKIKNQEFIDEFYKFIMLKENKEEILMLNLLTLK